MREHTVYGPRLTGVGFSAARRRLQVGVLRCLAKAQTQTQAQVRKQVQVLEQAVARLRQAQLAPRRQALCVD